MTRRRVVEFELELVVTRIIAMTRQRHSIELPTKDDEEFRDHGVHFQRTRWRPDHGLALHFDLANESIKYSVAVFAVFADVVVVIDGHFTDLVCEAMKPKLSYNSN